MTKPRPRLSFIGWLVGVIIGTALAVGIGFAFQGTFVAAASGFVLGSLGAFIGSQWRRIFR